MKNNSYHLFITSDINSFGKSFTITSIFIYSIISVIIIFCFFALFGFASFFFTNTSSSLNKGTSVNTIINFDSLTFYQDPVQRNKKDIFETSFITNKFSKNHKAIDINGVSGTKIYSPMPGRVFFSGYDKKLGNLLIISHNNGYLTKYMHNKKNFISTNDIVNIKKPIAEIGNSGSLVKNEGIHLHFELWKDGEALDPIKYINKIKLIDSDSVILLNNN